MPDLWPYALVVLAAAVPWLEVAVVIPAAVAAGLAPVPVGLLAFAGNAITLVLVVVGADQLLARRAATGHHRGARRGERVRRIARRWGLPGVAVLGPLVTGSHVAALAAVALRLPRQAVLAWSLAGVAAWTVVFVALSSAGRAIL